MAVTPVIQCEHNLSAEMKLYELTAAFDASYPTGGESLDATGNRRFRAVWCVGGSGGYVFDWDAANQKMLVYYGDNNNAADGALIQLPATTDLSALTAVKFCAIGA